MRRKNKSKMPDAKATMNPLNSFAKLPKIDNAKSKNFWKRDNENKKGKNKSKLRRRKEKRNSKEKRS